MRTNEKDIQLLSIVAPCNLSIDSLFSKKARPKQPLVKRPKQVPIRLAPPSLLVPKKIQLKPVHQQRIVNKNNKTRKLRTLKPKKVS